jgi:hypothetical protein
LGTSGRVELLEVGSSLQEARTRRGVALSDAEAATKIRSRYLDALEHERFDLMPEGPYGRSFLREYAEYLGLDGDILAAEYDLRFAPLEPPPEPPSNRAELARLLSEIRLRPPLVAVAVLAIVGVAVWQLGGSGSGTAPPPSATPVLAQTPTTPPAQSSAPLTRATPAAAAAHPSFSLTAARGTCWVAVHMGSSSGKTLYESTLQQGQIVRFGLSHPLWIRMGAPWNVDVAIGKRDLDASLPTRTGNVLVSASGLQATA